MADDNQDKLDDKKGDGGPNLLAEVVLFLFGLFIAGTLIVRIVANIGGYLSGDVSLRQQVPLLDVVLGRFFFILPFLQIFSIILSAVFVMLIIYVMRRRDEIFTEMQREVYPEGYTREYPGFIKSIFPFGKKDTNMPVSKNGRDDEVIQDEILFDNPRWKHVEAALESESQNDWRQAIIEADIMLGELLDKIGYEGVTIGDKLQQIERSDFTTLDQAWEAHKFRNRIAHEGSDMLLSKREAKRIIGLFEEVFREFRYI